MYQSFTHLEVYKECRKLRKQVSSLVKSQFPKEENFKLTDQVIRSSRRVTACIAEGHGRYHYKEEIQYCRLSRASLSETLEHLITAFDETYINVETLQTFKAQIDTCARLLNGYINFLHKNQHPKPSQ